jgi:hypothetical protein
MPISRMAELAIGQVAGGCCLRELRTMASGARMKVKMTMASSASFKVMRMKMKMQTSGLTLGDSGISKLCIAIELHF